MAQINKSKLQNSDGAYIYNKELHDTIIDSNNELDTKVTNLPSGGSFNPLEYMTRYVGQLPAGDANSVGYWQSISRSGVYISNTNQTNSKGAWSLVLILKAQSLPSTNPAITRILWFPLGVRFYVGSFSDGATPTSSVSWYQV